MPKHYPAGSKEESFKWTASIKTPVSVENGYGIAGITTILTIDSASQALCARSYLLLGVDDVEMTDLCSYFYDIEAVSVKAFENIQQLTLDTLISQTNLGDQKSTSFDQIRGAFAKNRNDCLASKHKLLNPDPNTMSAVGAAMFGPVLLDQFVISNDKSETYFLERLNLAPYEVPTVAMGRTRNEESNEAEMKTYIEDK